MSDFGFFATKIFDLVLRLRAEIKTVRDEAFMSGYPCVFELGVELPSSGANERHPLALLMLAPGFAYECDLNAHIP